MATVRKSPILPRALRQRSTEAERKLWGLLRSRRFAHLKWRRQAQIGNDVADFLCYERRPVVECDGSQHADSKCDSVRDAWLQEQGFTLVRFWNHEIMQNPVAVTDSILARAGLPF